MSRPTMAMKATMPTTMAAMTPPERWVPSSEAALGDLMGTTRDSWTMPPLGKMRLETVKLLRS